MAWKHLALLLAISTCGIGMLAHAHSKRLTALVRKRQLQLYMGGPQPLTCGSRGHPEVRTLSYMHD